MKTTNHPSPAIVTPAQWLAARRELLHHEKEITRLRDELATRRRELPWVQVTRDYRFDSAAGPVSLAELFAGRGQLIIQHFMLGRGWEEGCKSCSFMLDHLAATVVHLAARDVAFAVVSRAPLAEILSFQRRMGWNVNWVSAHATHFNEDFHVSFDAEETARGEVYYNYARRPFPFEEAPGISVFARGPDGTVYHTYSTYGRGVEVAMGTYPLLDLVPKGRDESGLEYGMEWVRHHDRYEHVLAHS